MVAQFEFELSYGQLAVFAGCLERPFNDWTTKHVSQGFAWRPNSVSFRSLVETGKHAVALSLQERVGALHPDTVRAIDVPFDAPEDGAIEIGSIAETFPISLSPGRFLLRCEFLASENLSVRQVRLTFASQDVPHFAVVLADAELSDYENLETTAEAALG